MWRYVLALLALTSAAAALNCVQCNTKESPGCADPMNSTLIQMYTRPCGRRQMCRKITFTENNMAHVSRDCAELNKNDELGCSWEIRVASKIGSGWDCFCEEDVCNGVGAAGVSLLLLLASALLTAGTVH